MEDLEKKYHVNVMAVKQLQVSVDDLGNPNRDEAVRLPFDSDIIRERDIFLVAGNNDDITALKEGKSRDTT